METEAAENNPATKSWTLAIIVFSLCCGTFLVALDTTIISVAVPSIATDFQAFGDVGWYGSAYLMTVTAFQPGFGNLLVHFNSKPIYLVSVIIFEVGSVLCAAAPSSAVFITGRAIAGIGAAGLYQGALAIVGSSVSLEKRPTYLAVVLSVFGIAACLGPPLGGILSEHATWKWCFWINLPIGIVAFVLIWIFLRLQSKGTTSSASVSVRLKSLDPPGVLLIIASVCCLILALHWGSDQGLWNSSRVIGLFVGTGVLLIAFFLVQWKQGDHATVPLRILRQRSVLMGALFSFFLEMSIYVMIYYIPFYFQSAQLVSPTTSGVRGIPLGVSQIAAVLVTGLIASWTGHYVPFMVLGQAVSIVGTVFLARLEVETSTALWATYLVISGVGHGMGLQMPFTAVQVVLSDEDVPIGNAIIVFFSQLGAAVAVAIGQSIFEASLTHEVLKGHVGFEPEAVIAAGPTGLHTLTKDAATLHALQEAYTVAICMIMYFALATSIAAVPFAGGMQWLNVRKVAKDKAMKIPEGQELVSGELTSFPAAPRDRRPIVISGPSGVGKGTLIQKLFDTHPDTFGFAVSHTTRKPRPGEVEGVAYFFVSPSEFSSLCSQGALVEHAYFSGDHYGTSKQTIDDQIRKGLVVVLDIEIQGVKQMKANASIDARYVFIRPPSFEALEARLRAQGPENEEEIQRRLAQARVEFEYADLQGSYDKIIVNDSVETAFREFEMFVFGLT